jgi:acetolactate synthase-1/2/3 large subunit
MLGMHGTYEANMAMQHCDVLLAVGARFDDRVIGNPKHFAQEAAQDHPHRHRSLVDLQAREGRRADRRRRARMCSATDPPARHDARPDAAALKAWWKQIDEWRGRKDCLKYDRTSQIIKPQFVIEKLYKVTGGDAFVTSDVGQHQMWAAQYYKFDKPRRWINSGGLGTMGVACRRDGRAARATPAPTVACVTGEGASRCASRSSRPASSTACR